jgi:hypothetical protein
VRLHWLLKHLSSSPWEWGSQKSERIGKRVLLREIELPQEILCLPCGWAQVPACLPMQDLQKRREWVGIASNEGVELAAEVKQGSIDEIFRIPLSYEVIFFVVTVLLSFSQE